jgi:SAM-dependent methyltransferase
VTGVVSVPDRPTVRALLSRSPAQLRIRDLMLAVGRRNYVVVREDLARRYLQGDGIEIGALDRPLRVPRGVRVRYVDYLDKPGLIRVCGADLAAAGIDPESIVDVDHVDQIDTLAGFEDESVDFVVAHHVLEQVEDPLAALANVLRILRLGAVAMLTLPDPRYSFDSARERTTAEHLLRDHLEGPRGLAEETL